MKNLQSLEQFEKFCYIDLQHIIGGRLMPIEETSSTATSSTSNVNGCTDIETNTFSDEGNLISRCVKWTCPD